MASPYIKELLSLRSKENFDCVNAVDLPDITQCDKVLYLFLPSDAERREKFAQIEALRKTEQLVSGIVGWSGFSDRVKVLVLTRLLAPFRISRKKSITLTSLKKTTSEKALCSPAQFFFLLYKLGVSLESMEKKGFCFHKFRQRVVINKKDSSFWEYVPDWNSARGVYISNISCPKNRFSKYYYDKIQPYLSD